MTQSATKLFACVCGLAATLATTGCTSTGVGAAKSAVRHADGVAQDEGATIIRAQSITEHSEGGLHPLGVTRHSQAIGNSVNPLHHGHLPQTELGNALNNHFHNTRVSYHDDSTNFNCPPGGMYDGGVYGAPCPNGACPGGLCGGRCIRNHHSYRVQQPKNLVYPQQNAVGGVTVYPYYTHKGPSDFFRQ